ncbi:MAG TPA: hypothetical protein DCR95_04620 [Desulfobacter sp.]|nr:hypothetical protein [Desulfobacter sp.]
MYMTPKEIIVKPLAECLYYMVREDFNARYGSKLEKNIYFDDALKHIREKGFENLEITKIEILALINAARRRCRLEELDQAVKGDKK